MNYQITIQNSETGEIIWQAFSPIELSEEEAFQIQDNYDVMMDTEVDIVETAPSGNKKVLAQGVKAQHGLRAELNTLVRDYCVQNNLPFRYIWNNLFFSYLMVYGLDIKERADKFKIRPIEYACRSGLLEDLIGVAYKIFA